MTLADDPFTALIVMAILVVGLWILVMILRRGTEPEHRPVDDEYLPSHRGKETLPDPVSPDFDIGDPWANEPEFRSGGRAGTDGIGMESMFGGTIVGPVDDLFADEYGDGPSEGDLAPDPQRRRRGTGTDGGA